MWICEREQLIFSSAPVLYFLFKVFNGFDAHFYNIKLWRRRQWQNTNRYPHGTSSIWLLKLSHFLTKLKLICWCLHRWQKSFASVRLFVYLLIFRSLYKVLWFYLSQPAYWFFSRLRADWKSENGKKKWQFWAIIIAISHFCIKLVKTDKSPVFQFSS